MPTQFVELPGGEDQPSLFINPEHVTSVVPAPTDTGVLRAGKSTIYLVGGRQYGVEAESHDVVKILSGGGADASQSLAPQLKTGLDVDHGYVPPPPGSPDAPNNVVPKARPDAIDGKPEGDHAKFPAGQGPSDGTPAQSGEEKAKADAAAALKVKEASEKALAGGDKQDDKAAEPADAKHDDKAKDGDKSKPFVDDKFKHDDKAKK